MLVNNIDISNFKARLLKKDIQTAEVVIYDDWLRNALNPLYIGKEEKYKQIKLELFIDDIDDESALNDISNLIKQFEKCTVKFDDLSYYYDCLIVNKNHERKAKGKYILNMEFKSGYAYKTEITETMDHVSSKTINVPGNLPSPAIIEITPIIDMVDIIISGFGDSFTIKSLQANQKVIVDGESCLVTQAGANKFSDYDGWNFPVLQPGSNTITISNTNCIVNIKYKPRWI